MPLAVIERALRVFPGVDFTNAYGLTETSATVCLLSPDDHRTAVASNDPQVRRRLGSVGKPLAAVQVQVRDAAGAVLAHQQSGMVFVRGAQVAGEYRGVGSLLDAAGWFATQDRGWVDAEGYLFLEGRADDLIVRGGENISPGEIEEALLAHPAVADAVVVAVPSDQWGEAVGAVVVVRSGATTSAAACSSGCKSACAPRGYRSECGAPAIHPLPKWERFCCARCTSSCSGMIITSARSALS
jgi:acyl-CoA synthetase (AMP-forming)/AMP-acid ligase II